MTTNQAIRFKHLLGYVKAKKGSDWLYRLFYVGTSNLVELKGKRIEETFESARTARSYLEAIYIKSLND